MDAPLIAHGEGTEPRLSKFFWGGFRRGRRKTIDSDTTFSVHKKPVGKRRGTFARPSHVPPPPKKKRKRGCRPHPKKEEGRSVLRADVKGRSLPTAHKKHRSQLEEDRIGEEKIQNRTPTEKGKKVILQFLWKTARKKKKGHPGR